MPRAFLIHGWDGNPNNHWFPWLSLELRARGWEVNSPQLPNAANPKVKEWLEFLEEYVGKPNERTYFVGHSLGCITIVRYIELLAPKVKIGGCVFVAGFSGRIEVPEISKFYSLPVDTEKVRIHCDRFVMIFSDNDPYVPIEKSLEFARELGAKTILERGKGHFCASDGVTALPSVFSSVLHFSF